MTSIMPGCFSAQSDGEGTLCDSIGVVVIIRYNSVINRHVILPALKILSNLFSRLPWQIYLKDVREECGRLKETISSKDKKLARMNKAFGNKVNTHFAL